MKTVHIIGAGLAGLSAAVHLVRAGIRVRLYEASPRAGGRCRSYFDAQLGCVIDNGNHIILGANEATYAYLDAIGSRSELQEIAPATFPFLDLKSGASWALRPNAGPIPWWIFSPMRRARETHALDYIRLARMVGASSDATVGDYVDPLHPIYARFVEPLATAILNADPREAAARPLANVLRATLLRGERACRPAITRTGLSKAFIDPALTFLDRRRGVFRANTRLERIDFRADSAAALTFAGETVELGPADSVVLATPAWMTGALLPDISYPREHRAIVNAHFRLPTARRFPGGVPLLALVGGTAQWLVARDDVISVTVSAADRLLDEDPGSLLNRLWRDVAAVLGREDPMPPARLIKEKRATYAQTPAAERLRPAARTRWRNVALAGDWIATGLPATIEGAIRSGAMAAQIAEGQR